MIHAQATGSRNRVVKADNQHAYCAFAAAGLNPTARRLNRTAIHARIVPCNTPVAKFTQGSAFGQMGSVLQNASGAVKAKPTAGPHTYQFACRRSRRAAMPM